MLIFLRRHEINPFTLTIRCDLSSHSFKRVFFLSFLLRKSHGTPLCFSEPWFSFPTFWLGRTPRQVQHSPKYLRQEQLHFSKLHDKWFCDFAVAHKAFCFLLSDFFKVCFLTFPWWSLLSRAPYSKMDIDSLATFLFYKGHVD